MIEPDLRTKNVSQNKQANLSVPKTLVFESPHFDIYDLYIIIMYK